MDNSNESFKRAQGATLDGHRGATLSVVNSSSQGRSILWTAVWDAQATDLLQYSQVVTTFTGYGEDGQALRLQNPGTTSVRPAQRLKKTGPEAVYGFEQPLGSCSALILTCAVKKIIAKTVIRTG